MKDNPTAENPVFPLLFRSKILFIVISWFLVAFGQPAWSDWLGLLAAVCGYAFFWRVLLSYSSTTNRFFLGTLWFFCVQLVQFSWFISHPYWYIYSVYFVVSLIFGLQFGFICLFIKFSNFGKFFQLVFIASLWTLLEWSRLFILSGVSWNPSGIALTSSQYAIQMASIWGVFGLSFWVILVNLLGLRAWIDMQRKKWFVNFGLWLIAAIAPYLFGFVHLSIHEKLLKQYNEEKTSNFTALLIQTAFPTEESNDSTLHTGKEKNTLDFLFADWHQILQIMKQFQNRNFDLIVFPEFVVPYGAYNFVYPVNTVVKAFLDTLGPESIKMLPPLQSPFSTLEKTSQGPQILVNNAFWIQGLSNFFKADILIGLEDFEDISFNKREYYSAALFFQPQHVNLEQEFIVQRYEKQILVPMGEYIPFSFCKDLAAKYGVFSSFTPGNESKIMTSKHIPFSPSICYEETFGNLIREGRQKGAKLLINLTNDAWYPNSRLSKQHFDHARLRTVENGVPLIRACNTGITGAVDSLGKTIAILGGDNPEKVEWISNGLIVQLPTYSYHTLYTFWGDLFIVSFCILSLLMFLFFR